MGITEHTTGHAGTAFPLPGAGRAEVAVPAPGTGPQRWAGAPSAALDADGSVVLAYRVRGDDDHNVIARSTDGPVDGSAGVPGGARFETVGIVGKERFGAAMVERPALVRLPSGGWRMYVCCATPGTKHWWIGVVEASDPERLASTEVRPVFDGDERTAVKDPVIRFDGRRWHAWICCHLLDEPGAEDRMNTAYATSDDGLSWRWHGTVLAGRPGAWDARGARLTSVLPDGRASYDGRATPQENWFERTGIAAPAGAGPQLAPIDGFPVVDVRYLEILPLPAGGHRIYYEARLPDESHELRTELV